MKKFIFLNIILFISIFTFSQNVSISEAAVIAENTITERILPLTGNNITFKINNSYTEYITGLKFFMFLI